MNVVMCGIYDINIYILRADIDYSKDRSKIWAAFVSAIYDVRWKILFMCYVTLR